MESFRTTDIILAAVLRLHDVELIDIEITGNKGTFVFTNVDDDFVSRYDLGKCSVEPVAFNNMIKQLTTSVRRMTNKPSFDRNN
jgi:hypothetical protein